MPALTQQVSPTAALHLLQRQELERVAVRIFNEHLFADASDTSYVEGLANSITNTVHHALALQLRAINESSFSQPRMPPELWAIVWAELNSHDRLVVTQVSHSWRQLASRCPQLWTELRAASNQHKVDCKCEVCHPPYDDAVRLSTRRGQCRWCLRHPHPRLGTNTPLIKHLIERSGGLPISLRADITGSMKMDATTVQDLSTALVPHARRLRTLDVHTDNPNILIHEFLAPLTNLSNLVELQLRFDSRGERTGPSMQQLHLPRLDVLDIAGRGFHLVGLSFFAPSVRFISCVVRTPSDIAHMLRACPAAQEVKMSVSYMITETVGPAVFDEMDQTAISHFLSSANPIRIQFVGMSIRYCSSIVAAFRSTAAEVVIDFDGGEPPADLLSFIANVEGATELELLIQTATHIGKVSFALSGGPGCRRRVDFDYDEDAEVDDTELATKVWAAVREPSTLRKIKVHSAMAAALFECAPELCMTELVVEFGSLDQADSLFDWLDPDVTGPVNTRPFAKLKNVAINATYEGPWYADLSEAVIISNIKLQLGLDLPERRDSLVTLSTKGLMVDIGNNPDEPVWRELARDAIVL